MDVFALLIIRESVLDVQILIFNENALQFEVNSLSPNSDRKCKLFKCMLRTV